MIRAPEKTVVPGYARAPERLAGSPAVRRERDPGAYLAGARAAVPFALVTLVVGISFGILARSLGWGIVAPIAFSVIAASASAQFAVAVVLASGGGALAAVVAAVLLNARFGPMGVAVAPYLKGGPIRRALEGQTVIDSSWAMANRGGGRFDREHMIGATIPQYATWVGGTVIGVMGEGWIGDPAKLGLDAVFPAFFLILLKHELNGARELKVVLISTFIALALTPFTPPGVPVIAACAATLIGLRRRSP